MRTWLVCLFALAVLIGSPAHAAPEKRVALVVGVARYEAVPALTNPTNDARLIAPLLEKLGFEVVSVIDPNHETMQRAFQNFAERLDGARVGLFYYAGHGLQVAGRNYLLPVDAVLRRETDLAYEAFDIQTILDEMDAPDRVNLVFLDACRDNPFARSLAAGMGARSVAVGRGLGAVETQASGTLIAYATAPDHTASDGNSADSPFASALAHHIGDPGLDVRLMLDRVNVDVEVATNGQQQPWVHANLRAAFYFVPQPSEPTPPAAGAATATGAAEIVFWQSIVGSSNPADYEAYLQQFPHGNFAALARIRLASLSARPAAPPVAHAAPPTSNPPSRVREPEMVRIPAGSFVMGTSSAEDTREENAPSHYSIPSGPQHKVIIQNDFLMAKTTVTRGEFAAFVRAEGERSAGGCFVYEPGKNNVWAWAQNPDRDWRHPGFDQTDEHPAVCVSYDDAIAYAAWLSAETGKAYRLPSEAEWEYAARGMAFKTAAHFWGDDPGPACQYANVADETLRTAKGAAAAAPPNLYFTCSDGSAFTAPVAKFKPNDYGLYDMLGNVWQWVADCWNENYNYAPPDGAAVRTGNCNVRVARGGSWYDAPSFVRTGFRLRYDPERRHNPRNSAVGFRLARTP